MKLHIFNDHLQKKQKKKNGESGESQYNTAGEKKENRRRQRSSSQKAHSLAPNRKQTSGACENKSPHMHSSSIKNMKINEKSRRIRL